jgi:hypothetical protein
VNPNRSSGAGPVPATVSFKEAGLIASFRILQSGFVHGTISRQYYRQK